jgi:hypothetical protein|nr:MAG TPA: major capsid protein [Caudoviricetes sp.]
MKKKFKKFIDEKVKRQQALLETAKAEARDLTEDEQALFNDLQREINDLNELMTGYEGEKGLGISEDDEVAKETLRCAEIIELCREFEVDYKDYINNRSSVEAVRKDILEKLKKEKSPVNSKARSDISVIKDEQDKFRAAAADGLILRSGDIPLDKASEGANDFRKMSLKDIAIMSLSRQGENIDSLMRLSPSELYDKITTERTYFSPEAAFPAILDTAINKSYIEMYTKTNTTFERFCKIGSLSDFKKHDNYYIAGPAGAFKEVPENGELVHDIPQDAKRPQRQLRTYGRQFTMSRKAFIDDDIGFLTTMPGRYARSAKTTINNQVYSVLFNSPIIYDGVQLFDRTTHKNVLATGTAPTSEIINKMLLALSTQKNEFDEAIIVSPKTIVVPVGYAMDIYKIFQSPTIETSGNTQAANPLYQLRNNLDVVDDATLNVLANGAAAPWFLMADSNDVTTIQIDFLNGQQIPNIRRMETPGVLGFTWDIYLDWGITVMDYRGIVKNPGIVIADPLA